MEEKELMLGDLVYYDHPIRIGALLSAGILYCEHYISYEALSPIPLTEEMLMLNGFEKYPWDNSAVQFVFLDEEALMHYGDGIFCYKENTNIKIKYVHELQHLLRLCGLSGLANNFKIE